MVLVNADFESLKPGLFRYPEGWVGIQHAGEQSYTFKLDSDERHRGQRSVRIDNVGPEPFGLVYQQVSVRDLRGSVVQLSGWLRTRGATGSATGGGGVLMLQAMRAGSPLAHNHMTANPAKGDTEWTRYAIVLSIPALADQIEVGAMLHGPGTLWIDDIELTVLPK